MGREFKFRAWFELENKMVFPENLVLSYDGEDCFDFAFDKETKDEEGNIKGTLNFNLMQYTGLKDKNGKDIYEGDIVMDWDDGYWYWEVKWNSEYGCFYIHEPHNWEKFYSDDMIGVFAEGTVVGNTYENPELLK